MLRHAVGRSGGLTYHFRALRDSRRDKRWDPFRDRVRHFLTSTWAPSERELVVFGPSAGWTLPFEWLRGFEKIVAVEPDPVARFLFAKRLPGTPIEFETSPERLPWFSNDERAFSGFLARHPNAAVLFSNLLGQVGTLVELDVKTTKGKRAEFTSGLSGRNWASYHDVLSSREDFKSPWPKTAPKGLEIESLARHYFGSASGTTEIVDHETTWLSEIEDRKTEFTQWSLTPRRNHLIAFVSPK